MFSVLLEFGQQHLYTMALMQKKKKDSERGKNIKTRRHFYFPRKYSQI